MDEQQQSNHESSNIDKQRQVQGQSAPPEQPLAAAMRTQREQAPRLASYFVVWMRDLILAACAAVFIIVFLFQPVRVEGTSMLPRLEDSDRVFINKFVYHLTNVERGDVVVFHYPRDPRISFIKRVIATPGERIRIDHGWVFINGKKLSEPYVPPVYRDQKSMPEIVVPAGEFFVMGDHRNISDDSRDFGTIDSDLIYGKATLVYWPAKDAGVVK